MLTIGVEGTDNRCSAPNGVPDAGVERCSLSKVDRMPQHERARIKRGVRSRVPRSVVDDHDHGIGVEFPKGGNDVPDAALLAICGDNDGKVGKRFRGVGRAGRCAVAGAWRRQAAVACGCVLFDVSIYARRGRNRNARLRAPRGRRHRSDRIRRPASTLPHLAATAALLKTRGRASCRAPEIALKAHRNASTRAEFANRLDNFSCSTIVRVAQYPRRASQGIVVQATCLEFRLSPRR